MSLSSNNSATTYNPGDLSLDVQKVVDTHFQQNQFLMDSAEFQIDPQVAIHMGLSNAKSKEEKRLFDAEVFKFVQKIKDDAYEQAYKQGREEGLLAAKEEALSLSKEEIQKKIQSLTETIKSLNNSRLKMYEENEVEIVRFCYLLAEKILIKEMKQNKDYILEIIRKMIPSDENCTIHLCEEDHTFIQQHLHLLVDSASTQALKFAIDPRLSIGDVIVETPNGTLDGSLKMRLEKLKHSLEQLE